MVIHIDDMTLKGSNENNGRTTNLKWNETSSHLKDSLANALRAMKEHIDELNVLFASQLLLR